MSNTNWTDQRVETITPLVGSATFTAPGQDCALLGRYGVSVFVSRDTVDTNADVIVENSDDNSAWRFVKLTNLVVTAGVDAQYNEAFVPLRQFMRFRIVNKTANDFGATEGVRTIGPGT